jgi:predicted nucleotidyltransferase
MKEQINKVIEYLKTLDVNGCITGSCLLPEQFEGSDVDVFVYDKKSLDRLI